MKEVVMYQSFNYDFGAHYQWHAERGFSDWEPFRVEIPEDFELGESVSGEKMYFRGDDKQGYSLEIDDNSPEGVPVLIGGASVEIVELRVLGPALEGIIEII